MSTTCGTTRRAFYYDVICLLRTWVYHEENDIDNIVDVTRNSDLETRKKTREQAWKVDGWAETVYNTGKDAFLII